MSLQLQITKRMNIVVRGLVQGVGFRPYIYSLARQHALKGQVSNSTAGVVIDVEGNEQDIKRFVQEIQSHPPPLARIERIECTSNPVLVNYPDFQIAESTDTGKKFVPISADVAICQDCLRELFDPNNRRYRYPFINCTNCGPRFTIIEDIPYDRTRTTMRDFPMCDACRAEYENPLDRRFHAEPTACETCGPRVFLTDSATVLQAIRSGSDEPMHARYRSRYCGEVIQQAQQMLRNGAILAIKGLGGFHLACDALNAETVERLRSRKYREDKPFALMAGSLNIIRQYCFVEDAEETLLLSERRPIVLLERKPEVTIPPAIAPRTNKLGFMLPYTPLHYLLLEKLDRPLVMTSGNVSDEPICYEDQEAATRLTNIADYFLWHDRRIHMRTDDSVTRVQAGRESIMRRARGYAPAPIKTAFRFQQQILACGAELKNTFCLTRDNYAFVSHHIGDLENLETLGSFTDGIEHFQRLFALQPTVIAYDLHPEYLSTKYALARDDIAVKIGVQHHHAHIASCLVDNQVEGEVIGVAMDGLGFGADGCLWGGEFFVADFAHAERIAHLDYIPMPGGSQAIREPWRMAAVYLQRTLGDDFLNLDLPFTQQLDQRAWKTLRRMIATNTNCPATSSMGRLFDAVASLLGLRNSINYEGQAAIELEAIADRSINSGYEFAVGSDGIIKAEPVIQQAVAELLNGRAATEIAARFHLAVVQLIVTLARQVREERHLSRVALSGGVFQNMLLLERARQQLAAEGFEVFTHSRVPANDGGISLGQAAVANAKLAAALPGEKLCA